MDKEAWDWMQNNYFSVTQPTLKNSAGIEPLILAAQQGRDDIVKFLLEQGASLWTLDSFGNNALWAACYANSHECIKLLLDAGIDINFQNTASGATVLIFAASSGRESVVEQLIEAGAAHDLTTLDDFTALDLASTPKILKLLHKLVKSGD